MNVSNVSAYQALSALAPSGVNATSAQSRPDALTSAANASASAVSSTASVLPSRGSYDFAAISSKDFIKATEGLFYSSQLSRREFLTGVVQAVHGNFLTIPGAPGSAGPRNFLGELQQELDHGKQRSAYLPSDQIATIGSLLDKLTALQGTPKIGVDKYV